MAVIHVSGFRKTYGSTVAVDDVSFDVNAGEILGLVDASERAQSGNPSAPEFRVVLNWFEDLKARVPANLESRLVKTDGGSRISHQIGVDREPSERSRRPYNSSQLGPCSRAQEGAAPNDAASVSGS
jgi:ABC-type uncharacterized transport system ATPase subunit